MERREKRKRKKNIPLQYEAEKLQRYWEYEKLFVGELFVVVMVVEVILAVY